MLHLTDLSGNIRLINPQKILEIRSVPDTLLMFLDGNRIMVRETRNEVFAAIREISLAKRDVNRLRVTA